MNQNNKHFEANRKLWNAKTGLHAKSAFYDMASFKAGKTTLKPAELEALGDVKGKSILHLQCHFGQDSLSLARMGAEVTGIDLSDKSIDLARSLNTELGLSARFVNCNLYDVSEHLEGEKFDFLLATYGTICWLPDLETWAEIVNRHLKPGGKLVLVEFHPTWDMFNFDTLDLEYSYFGKKDPFRDLESGTYADRDASIELEEYFWNHSISEIISPLLNRNLKLNGLTEYPYSYYDCFPTGEVGKDGLVRIKGKEGMLPLMLRMVFEKPEI